MKMYEIQEHCMAASREIASSRGGITWESSGYAHTYGTPEG